MKSATPTTHKASANKDATQLVGTQEPRFGKDDAGRDRFQGPGYRLVPQKHRTRVPGHVFIAHLEKNQESIDKDRRLIIKAAAGVGALLGMPFAIKVKAAVGSTRILISSSSDIVNLSAVELSDSIKLYAQYDYLVLPSAQVFPFDAKIHWPKEVAGKTMDTYHRWMEIVVPGTLSGCPTANVPVGFNSQGIPMGMQIMGPAKQDLKVLQLAHAYEQESNWTQNVPP